VISLFKGIIDGSYVMSVEYLDKKRTILDGELNEKRISRVIKF